MSTFSRSFGILGANEKVVDHHYDEDALLDTWLSGGKSKLKKNKTSTQNDPIVEHTPFGLQKTFVPIDASQPLPSATRSDFWDTQKRQDQAHTSSLTRDETAFIGAQSSSDDMRGDFHPPDSFSSRFDHDKSSFTAHEDHPTAPEVTFTAMSTMANASYSPDHITQADVHENFWQRSANWPKEQGESREGQNKRVSFERTEANAAHSRNDVPITQPTPTADEAIAFRRSASRSEQELAYQGAKKRISDAVSCWQDVQALLCENFEAGKQIFNQNVDLKANIAFLETLCREKQFQIQKKDEVVAKKDAQLENKDAQLAAKDTENSNERRNLAEFRLELEKLEEALKSSLRDGDHISKEWEDFNISVKADWQNLKVQVENQKSLNKDLMDSFEAFKSKQVSFKKEVEEFSEKLFSTEEHLKMSQDTVNALSAKLSAANDDAQRAQQDFERKLEEKDNKVKEKDNEVRIADAGRLSSKQELTQMQKELEVAKLSSTTKQNELNTAESTIKQLRERYDKLVEKLEEEEKIIKEAEQKAKEQEQKAKEQEQKAYEYRNKMEEKTKAIDRIINERERLEKALSVSNEKVDRHKEAEEEFKAREERLKAREESAKALEESLKAREESLKAREGSWNARGESTSKVRKETHDRESDTVKGKTTSTQSIDDQKISKNASNSRKKARHEPPPMDSD